MAYVITAWTINDHSSGDTLVELKGRDSGLLSWLLSLFGIEPTVTMRVTRRNIEFSQGSLAGYTKRIVPVVNVCSTLYGYTKPWQTAAAILVFGIMLGSGAASVSPGLGAFVMLLGVVAAAAYYILNKVLTLGFVEDSGVFNAIQFKRSVIEGKNIDESDAAKVIAVIQNLVDAKTA